MPARSYPSIDNLASAVERRAPEMGTIRFHSYHSEMFVDKPINLAAKTQPTLTA